jgi:hypothetical protein
MKWAVWTALGFFLVWLVGCWPGTAGDSVSVTGTVDASAVGKWAPNAQSVNQSYCVVAQSSQTGEVYRAMTDATGWFQMDLPASEASSTFVFGILDTTGRSMGALVMGQDGDDGITGVDLDGQSESLGHIILPADPTKAPLRPGTDSSLADQTNAELTARLNSDGVPVGVPNVGKGDDALFNGVPPVGGPDRDRDGLIDMVDADDDGDGIVDDFDADTATGGPGSANFFMNLKIGSDHASTYYTGSQTAIDARLATDTVITMEVLNSAFAGQTITSVQCQTSPAPSYISSTQKMTDTPGGLTYSPWSDSSYLFDSADDRWQAFVIPGAAMAAGDMFTVEITFDDGSTTLVSRMINYVFKNIPKLIQYGKSGALNAFDVNSATVNGSPNNPIPFDGTQDLVLVFEPPVDELGTPITNLDYKFEVFYYDAAGSTQLNESIDGSATWPTAITNWDPQSQVYSVQASALTLAGGAYTVSLPKEILPDTVTTGSGNTAVSYYKIDIAAQKNGNNAAIMLAYRKN